MPKEVGVCEKSEKIIAIANCRKSAFSMIKYKVIKLIYEKSVNVILWAIGGNMKKIIALCCFLLIGVTGCKNIGNVTNVKIKEVNSEIYSKEEIYDAINIIINDFKDDWDDCTLNEICYIGDIRNNDFIDWATRNNKEEVIVLNSNFTVGSYANDKSLNLNSEYNNWNWILVRNKNESWQHIDHGY